MKKIYSVILLLIIFSSSLYSQLTYKTIRGSKANYSISIPTNYNIEENTNDNVDINYSNSEGSSINIVVIKLPSSVSEKDVTQLLKTTNQEFINKLNAGGIENVTIIKRGVIFINGIKSVLNYYKDDHLYYYTVMQFRKGNAILLTYTCVYNKIELYLPVIKKVANSLKT